MNPENMLSSPPHRRDDDPFDKRLAGLAKILSDLDRCRHGRHRREPCYGCPDGLSIGNPHIPQPGKVVGYDITGATYVMPGVGESCGDPESWRP